MPEEDTPPITTNDSGDIPAPPTVTENELPDFLKARQELADNPQINESSRDDISLLSQAEKRTRNRLDEMLTTPEGEPETLFGLVNSLYSNGNLIEARTNNVINTQEDNGIIRERLTQDTRDALDDFSAVNMLLKENKLEAEGLPDDEQVRDLLSEFMVTQRHLIHLAGEMSANGPRDKQNDLGGELSRLREKRFNLYSELVAKEDKLSGELKVSFVGDEEEVDQESVKYPLVVRGPRRPELPKPEDEEDSDWQEALDKISEINPDELPEDKDELEQINEWMQTVLSDDSQEEDDEKYGVYQRLSKRVKENQDDLRLLRQATEYRLNTLKEILQSKGVWPEEEQTGFPEEAEGAEVEQSPLTEEQQEALNEVVQVEEGEFPEDAEGLTRLNEQISTILPEDEIDAEDEDASSYSNLSKRVGEERVIEDEELYRRATEYRYNKMRSILERKGLWPEEEQDSDAKGDRLDESEKILSYENYRNSGEEGEQLGIQKGWGNIIWYRLIDGQVWRHEENDKESDMILVGEAENEDEFDRIAHEDSANLDI